jgi:GcrA cell cycle regulator
MEGLVWTDELKARLAVLWSDGHSASEIARRMGTTKNAVIGKANRMGLARRPSPIRRKAS